MENVRSFLDPREITFEGDISILIGPNGGGKTNLLDTLVGVLRRYVFNTPYFTAAPTAEDPDLWHARTNDLLGAFTFHKHSAGKTRKQRIELELEVGAEDVQNMRTIHKETVTIRAELAMLGKRISPDPWVGVEEWRLSEVAAGQRVTVVWEEGSLKQPQDIWARDFLSYLHLFESDNLLRAELKRAPLQLPMIYLPVNRAVNGFNSRIDLAGYNDHEQKRNLDATSSRNAGSSVAVAIGRLSQRFRLLLEESNADAKLRFYGEPTVKELTEQLKALGYDWELFTVNPITNSYDVRLSKQGTSFLVSEASSGERELLTYLFAIFALNVRNAVIIVDEPELHLHPRWQSSLLALFVKLSKSTGNQFIFATHSPTFISPRSIQYVSRVYSEQQRSNIVRMNSADLPNIKHLFNIVNSENNQRMLFSDAVVLVEGLHDRMVFERILSILVERSTGPTPTLEVVSIGGKGLFPAYQKLLDACKVPWWSVADLDYIEQIGSPDLKSLFAQNNDYIKTDVFENIKSRDGDTFVRLVEQAMQSGDWHDARDLWAYIKSRRRTLRDSLDPAQEAALAEFIEQCKTRRIYLLSRGALEDYLPVGYRSKDTEKLIELIGSDDFWDKLDLEGRRELESMALIFLETAAVPPQASQPTE